MWELHIWYHIVMLHAMVGLHMDPLMWERLKLYIWRIDLNEASNVTNTKAIAPNTKHLTPSGVLICTSIQHTIGDTAIPHC